MKLVRDSEGRIRDESGRAIRRQRLDDEQWSKLTSYIGRYADYLTDATRDQFERLLTIWMHPWETQESGTRPSSTKKRIESFDKAIAEARMLLETLLREVAFRKAMRPYETDWSELSQHLSSAPELVAITTKGIASRRPGAQSDDAHAFVEQIDSILSETGLLLETSEINGRDFVGFVMRLMDLAGLAPPERANAPPARTKEEKHRTYAKTLVRARVKLRNLMDFAHENDDTKQ